MNGSLPAFNDNVQEICLVTSQENSNIHDLSKVIMRDCGLATSVLDTINSAIYGLRLKILTISSAIRYLGFNKVKSLALGLTIMQNGLPTGTQSRLQKLYGEAFFCGFFSLALAESYKHKDPEEAFVVGLLKELPMLAMNYSFPLETTEIQEEVQKGGDFEKLFKETFDCQYRDISREVLKLYKISGSTADYITRRTSDDPLMNQLIRQAKELSNSIFSGQVPSSKLLKEIEGILQKKTRNKQLSIFKFLKSVMLGDSNLKRFFQLDDTDISNLINSFENDEAIPAALSAKISGHKTIAPKDVKKRKKIKVLKSDLNEETQATIGNPVMSETLFEQFTKDSSGKVDRNSLFGKLHDRDHGLHKREKSYR